MWEPVVCEYCVLGWCSLRLRLGGRREGEEQLPAARPGAEGLVGIPAPPGSASSPG